jgi:hypothetical protein
MEFALKCGSLHNPGRRQKREVCLAQYFVPIKRPEDPRPPDPRRTAAIGFVVIALLVIGGLFLVHVLRDASRLQDCVMQGRSNCAPIDAGR